VNDFLLDDLDWWIYYYVFDHSIRDLSGYLKSPAIILWNIDNVDFLLFT
jgi:hypothetical protein